MKMFFSTTTRVKTNFQLRKKVIFLLSCIQLCILNHYSFCKQKQVSFGLNKIAQSKSSPISQKKILKTLSNIKKQAIEIQKHIPSNSENSKFSNTWQNETNSNPYYGNRTNKVFEIENKDLRNESSNQFDSTASNENYVTEEGDDNENINNFYENRIPSHYHDSYTVNQQNELNSSSNSKKGDFITHGNRYHTAIPAINNASYGNNKEYYQGAKSRNIDYKMHNQQLNQGYNNRNQAHSRQRNYAVPYSPQGNRGNYKNNRYQQNQNSNQDYTNNNYYDYYEYNGPLQKGLAYQNYHLEKGNRKKYNSHSNHLNYQQVQNYNNQEYSRDMEDSMHTQEGGIENYKNQYLQENVDIYQDINHQPSYRDITRKPLDYNSGEFHKYQNTVKNINKEYYKNPDNLNENSLDINIDIFIGEFLKNANSMNLNYRIDSRPRRISGPQKDNAVFCFNTKRLCFSVIWEKGKDNINTLAMVTTGDGTQHSADDTIKTVYSFIYTITPGLSKENVSEVISKMGILSDADIGNAFIAKPNGRQIRYEHARSMKAGLVIIASPM